MFLEKLIVLKKCLKIKMKNHCRFTVINITIFTQVHLPSAPHYLQCEENFSETLLFGFLNFSKTLLFCSLIIFKRTHGTSTPSNFFIIKKRMNRYGNAN